MRYYFVPNLQGGRYMLNVFKTARQKLLTILNITIIVALVTVLTIPTALAGSGEIMGVKFSVTINSGKTAEQTLVNQEILRSQNFGDDNKIKQAVVSAPAEGGEFKFGAKFQMNQSTMLMGRFELWNALVKPTATQVNNMTTDRTPNVDSYVDLVAEADPRITVPANLTAYFDSHTWRPTHVFDQDYNLLADVRDSYTAGQSEKTFTFPSNGKKTYIIRTVPIHGQTFTNAQKDAPMNFGFDKADNNFTVSREVVQTLVTSRKEMTPEQIKQENEILAKTTFTAQDVQTLKTNNLFFTGKIQGKVKGEVTVWGMTIPQEMPINNQIPPAGVAVTYSYPSVTFIKNDGTPEEITQNNVTSKTH